MYNWDITKLDACYNRFLEKKSNFSPHESDFSLTNYMRLYAFDSGVYEEKPNYSTTPFQYFIDIAKQSYKLIKSSNITKTVTYKELLKQKGIIISNKQIILSTDFNVEDALDTTKAFLSELSPVYLDWFQQLINEKSFCLRRNEKNSNINGFISESGLKNVFIGILAPNIETMMYTIVHEFGHFIAAKNGLAEVSDDETVSKLLELYLFDYLDYRGYNSIPYFQEDYAHDRNNELSTLRLYDDIYKSDDDYYFSEKIRDFINSEFELHSFENIITYCLARYRAIDHYNKTKDRLNTINKVIDENTPIHTLFQLFQTTSPNIFSKENEDIVKRLVRG